MGSADIYGLPDLGQTTRRSDSQQKREPADHRLKLKESEKRDKCLDFAREMQKLLNMTVTIILTVTCALGIVIKGLVEIQEELEIRRREETVQTTELLRSAIILRHEETCCHLNSCVEPSLNASV